MSQSSLAETAGRPLFEELEPRLLLDAVSPEQALRVATTFLATQETAAPAHAIEEPVFLAGAGPEAYASSLGIHPVQGEGGDVLAYVVQRDPEGFVIVGGDDDIRPVLGYSLTGSFPLDDTPDNVSLHLVRADVEARLSALALAEPNGATPAAANEALWQDYISADPGLLQELGAAQTWGPWITFSTWDQGDPWNKYCPDDPRTGAKVDVGCVATAASQIAYYWAYPASIPFSSGDEYTSWGENGHIHIDDDAGTYNFPDLPSLNSALSTINYDSTEDEMAYLSFGLGVKLEMHYSSSGSGASTAYARSVYLNDLGYGSAQKDYDGDGCWADNVDEAISNLKNGWPLQIGIKRSGATGGHSVLVDGYKSTGEFHVNLGWAGAGDAWYFLPDILSYDVVHTVVYDISPYRGWSQVGADPQNSFRTVYTIPTTQPDLKWEVTAGMSRYDFDYMVAGTGGKIYAALSPKDIGQGKPPYVCVINQHGWIEKTIPISGFDYDINYVSQNSRGEVFFGTSRYLTKSSVFRVNPKTETVTRIFDHTSPDRGIFDQPVKIDADDYLYFVIEPTFVANSAKFYSLTRTGSLRWSYSFPSQMKFYNSYAAIDEARNSVYINYYDSSAQKSYVRCFSRANGSVKWTHALPGTHTASEMASPPTIGPDGTVYVGCFTSVYALSPTTGNELWDRDFYPAYVMGRGLRAVGDDGTVYVAHGKTIASVWHPGFMSALDPSDGSINWQQEVAPGLGSFDNMGEIYVGGNKVVAFTYSRSGSGRLGGVIDQGTSGQVAWDVGYGGTMAFGPGQTIYVASAASIYALSVGDRGDPDGLGMAYTDNSRPDVPSDPSPGDGSHNVDTSVTLSWSCSDPEGHTLKYDVFVGEVTSDMMPVATGISGTSFTVDHLQYGTSYGWNVVTTDGQAVADGPRWHFDVADWCNEDLAEDVNENGSVEPLDALIIINKLNAEGSHELQHPGDPYPHEAGGYCWDTDGDGWVAPLDALRVINYINNPPGGGGLGGAIEQESQPDVGAAASFGSAFPAGDKAQVEDVGILATTKNARKRALLSDGSAETAGLYSLPLPRRQTASQGASNVQQVKKVLPAGSGGIGSGVDLLGQKTLEQGGAQNGRLIMLAPTEGGIAKEPMASQAVVLDNGLLDVLASEDLKVSLKVL